MKSAKQSPFCLDYVADMELDQGPAIDNKHVEKIIKIIPERVKELLDKFKGLEAFYEVHVEVDEEKRNENLSEDVKSEDVRKVVSLKTLKDDKEFQKINFYLC